MQRERIHAPDEYPFCLAVIRNLETLSFQSAVTFFVGDNGSGKSTLLEAIAVAAGLNAEGGGRHFRFGTRASHSNLSSYLRLTRTPARPTDDFFLRVETLYNLATEVERLEVSGYGDRSLHEQSHGESLLAILVDRLRGDGLYLLDEPEAALSPSRQLAALVRIHDLVEQHSQFVISTHSPILMAYPGADILQLTEAGVVRTRYEDTEQYLITRDVLNAPAKIMSDLFAEHEDSG